MLSRSQPTSGLTVRAEVGVAVLVQYCHDQKSITEDPVANCVREAVGWNLALDDPIFVVTKDGLAGVGPSRRPDDGCMDCVEEAVAESFFLVLVPVPGVREVEVDEVVVLDAKAHAPRWARRSANRCWMSSQVSVPASPDSSIDARRCVSADHRPSISFSSTASGRRLATTVDGLMVAPWPRVFADVRTVGIRGEEAAEHLREAMHGR